MDLPNFNKAPGVGTRAWLSTLMDETLPVIPGVWQILDTCMVEEEACNLAILSLGRLYVSTGSGTDHDLQFQVDKMRDAGQKEYARSSQDAFANFRRVADVLDLSPRQALAAYLCKHLDGIQAHMDGHVSQREAVGGRIVDAIVYLYLLKGMIRADV